MAEQYCRGRYDFAKLNLNLNFKLVLFSVDTTTYTHPTFHPPTHRESGEVEQDHNYFNLARQVQDKLLDQTALSLYKYRVKVFTLRLLYYL